MMPKIDADGVLIDVLTGAVINLRTRPIGGVET